MQIKNFEDLEIWKESRRLTRDVYDLSKEAKFFKDFGLGDQMRRAAISIMSNIAEGFERVAAIKSSSNTSTLPRARAARSVRNFTWRSIKSIWSKIKWKVC
jgi:hypothetical protein